jgi:hypothetical protein
MAYGRFKSKDGRAQFNSQLERDRYDQREEVKKQAGTPTKADAAFELEKQRANTKADAAFELEKQRAKLTSGSESAEVKEAARQKKYFDKFILERDQQLAALETEKKQKKEEEVRIAIQSAMSRRARVGAGAVGFGPFGGGISGGFGGFTGQLRRRAVGFSGY